MSKSRKEIRDEEAIRWKKELKTYSSNYVSAFSAGFDAGLATADAEHAAEMKECISRSLHETRVRGLVEALQDIAHTPIELAQYSVKDAQWEAREALASFNSEGGE